MGFFDKIISVSPRSVKITPFTEEHAVDLAEKLSDINIRELRALTDLSPVWALSMIARHGENYVIHDNMGNICGAFGIVPEDNIKDCAALWMVTTPNIKNISMSFIKGSKKWIESFNERFTMIYCRVYDGNEFTKRWLTLMGFDNSPEIGGVGLHGEKFIEFFKIKE